jgi:hypothetical protein
MRSGAGRLALYERPLRRVPWALLYAGRVDDARSWVLARRDRPGDRRRRRRAVKRRDQVDVVGHVRGLPFDRCTQCDGAMAPASGPTAGILIVFSLREWDDPNDGSDEAAFHSEFYACLPCADAIAQGAPLRGHTGVVLPAFLTFSGMPP